MIDIEAVRADIPALASITHFNNAGTSLMPRPVFEAMLDYLHREQEIGGYETAMEREGDTEDFYRQAARLINARPEDIAFFEGASRAWQVFFYSLDLQPGDRIITTQHDYGSNIVGFLHQRKRRDVEVVVVDTNALGSIDLDGLADAINDRTRLISLSHIPTANGVINPAAAVGKLAKRHGIPFLLDACQSVGQIEVDVRAIGCTALSAAGRKYLRGPRGTGFLYVDSDYRKVNEPAWLEQHNVELLSRDDYRLLDSARRYENFETGFAARIALGKALAYANEVGPKNYEARICELGAYCRQQLRSIPGITVADTGERQGGIVMFSREGTPAGSVREILRDRQIQVWVSSGPGGLVDFQARGITELVRASLHYFNTEAEIDRMVDVLRRT